ncbi:MAG: hypothetical protein PHY92_09660 [Alphaproteobacteria bacterium]|nr:hypothetical protein [Alphaproteobacteria bacterium]
MSAKNARSAMSANKRKAIGRSVLVPGILALASFLTAANGYAYEGAAPALSNVKEMVVQGLRISDTAANKNCGITAETLSKALLKSLKNYGLPAFSLIEAKPSMMGVARIELFPEVVSANTEGIVCTSWVSVSAQTQNTLPLPPIETPRNVIVTYWRGGVLVSSVESTHGKVLADAFEKLARQLSIQFNRDQPPPLPSFGDEEKQ